MEEMQSGFALLSPWARTNILKCEKLVDVMWGESGVLCCCSDFYFIHFVSSTDILRGDQRWPPYSFLEKVSRLFPWRESWWLAGFSDEVFRHIFITIIIIIIAITGHWSLKQSQVIMSDWCLICVYVWDRESEWTGTISCSESEKRARRRVKENLFWFFTRSSLSRKMEHSGCWLAGCDDRAVNWDGGGTSSSSEARSGQQAPWGGHDL